ncbi:MAG: hypothetical protein ACYTG0_33475 [Planctomycetota bacterium]|jgi:hypothetical protein
MDTARTAQSMLCAHQGSEIVTREQLRHVVVPAARGPMHRPVPHIDVVEAVEASLGTRHIEIIDEAFAIQTRGTKFFGVLQLRSTNGAVLRAEEDPETGIAMGLRSGNDCSLSISINTGVRVFVCDNLAFSGQTLAMNKKHTIGLRLQEEVDEAVERYIAMTASTMVEIENAKAAPLTPMRAKCLLHDQFAQGVLPSRFFAEASRNYFSPQPAQVDCHDRTVWALHNALTRCIRELAPGPKFTATVKLGKLLTEAPRHAA